MERLHLNGDLEAHGDGHLGDHGIAVNYFIRGSLETGQVVSKRFSLTLLEIEQVLRGSQRLLRAAEV